MRIIHHQLLKWDKRSIKYIGSDQRKDEFRKRTFVLHGLALPGGRTLGDGAGDKEDELLGGRPLEVSEMADVGGVGEDHGIRRPRRRR